MIGLIKPQAPDPAPINFHSADERCGIGTEVTQVCKFSRAGDVDRREHGGGRR